MKWFGESWGAPVCEPDDHVDRPDASCVYCMKPLIVGDQGLVVPFAGGPGDPIEVAFHRKCFMRSVREQNATEDTST